MKVTLFSFQEIRTFKEYSAFSAWCVDGVRHVSEALSTWLSVQFVVPVFSVEGNPEQKLSSKGSLSAQMGGVLPCCGLTAQRCCLARMHYIPGVTWVTLLSSGGPDVGGLSGTPP